MPWSMLISQYSHMNKTKPCNIYARIWIGVPCYISLLANWWGKKKTWRYSCGDNEQRNRVDKWLDICGKKLTRWRGDKERRIYIVFFICTFLLSTVRLFHLILPVSNNPGKTQGTLLIIFTLTLLSLSRWNGVWIILLQ